MVEILYEAHCLISSLYPLDGFKYDLISLICCTTTLSSLHGESRIKLNQMNELMNEDNFATLSQLV